jgi:hypothetical protein
MAVTHGRADVLSGWRRLFSVRLGIAGACLMVCLALATPALAAPTPPEKFSSVSCAATMSCAAVGYNSSAGTTVTLAESWNGTSWQAQSTPNPTGATSSVLNGVACRPNAAQTFCSAVGRYFTSSAQLMLAENRNGAKWSIVTVPSPVGAKGSELLGVSCTSPKACTAVGDYRNSAGANVTLAERWNGATWSVQGTPNHSGAALSVLRAVSCWSTTACTAVGSYFSSGGSQLTLGELWNGHSWSIQPTPNPAGATQSALGGVSCPGASACSAVGSSSQHMLAERWNGHGWSIQTTPSPTGATESILGGVSCTATTACTAVGVYINSGGLDVTLAERLSGQSWSSQTPANVAGTKYDSLSGVSCTGATACTAVGNYYMGTASLTLAEAWDGTTWSIQPSP